MADFGNFPVKLIFPKLKSLDKCLELQILHLKIFICYTELFTSNLVLSKVIFLFDISFKFKEKVYKFHIMLKKKNIVITGALGQDGIILSKILLKKKYNVFGIVKKLNFKQVKNINYHKIDLLDYKSVSSFLDKVNPISLIHLGTENPNYIELKIKKDFYGKNLKASKNLIKYFSQHKVKKKLILVGTSQMYGTLEKVNLKSKFNPLNSYARFRLESYKDMSKNKRKYNLNIVMAILFNHDSMYRKNKFLIPRLIKMIKSKNFKKLNEIYKQNISGDFSHAEDICNGLYKLIISKNNPDKLIFSSNIRTYVNDIIKFLLKKNNIKKNFTDSNLGYTSTPIGDNSFTKKTLKWNIKKDIFIAANELNKL
jgi:GDPmannose 4,6-dehydratase